MAEKKITKQSCSKKYMKEYLEKGLAEKTIKKKAYNDFKKSVKAIEIGEGTEAEKLKAVKALFYDTFIKTQQVKKEKSAHPLYDMFNEIEVKNDIEQKEEQLEEKKEEPVEEQKE